MTLDDQSRFIGGSPSSRRDKAILDILELLPGDGSPVRWSDLKKNVEEIGMSSATLSKYLKLLDGLLIGRTVDEKRQVWYQLITLEQHPAFKGVRKISHNILPDLEKLRSMKDREMAELLLQHILTFSMLDISYHTLQIFVVAHTKKERRESLKLFSNLVSGLINPLLYRLYDLCVQNEDVAGSSLGKAALKIYSKATSECEAYLKYMDKLNSTTLR